MNQESLAELLVRKRWYNPFPKFKFTERPDAAAAQILEGDVVVLVDNSPAAIILPTTLFDVMEEAMTTTSRPSPAPTCGWSGFLPPFSLPSLPRCGSC